MATAAETVYQFVVPEHLKPLLDAGKLIRRGALLIDPSGPGSGIVAHLQETRALARVAESAWNPLSFGMQAVTLTAEVGNVVQNEQIRRRIDTMQRTLGTMQSLQVAGLVGSVASIGVSAAGTKLILDRLKTLNKGMKRIEKEVHAFREEWKMDELMGLLNRATTHVGRVNDARRSNDSATILRTAEQVLDEVFDALSQRGQMLVVREEIPFDTLKAVISGMVTAGDARTKALFLLDDVGSAASCARKRMQAHVTMVRMAPRDVLAQRLQGVECAQNEAGELSHLMNEVRLRIASVPPLLATLEVNNAKPSEFLAASEAETDAPLMFLPSARS